MKTKEELGYGAAEAEIKKLNAKLAKAVELGTYFQRCAANFLKPDLPVEHGLFATFYHTLSYNGDRDMLEEFRQNRQALAEISNTKSE
jgi:hypothetical protein